MAKLTFQKVGIWVIENNIKLSALIAVFTLLSTFYSQYFFTKAFLACLFLAMGTAFISFIILSFIHFLLFKWLKKTSLKYLLILLYPVYYTISLIVFFGATTSLLDFTLFRVTFVHQVFLQIWAFLAQSFFYFTFSPKISQLITCLLVMGILLLAIRADNAQKVNKTPH